MTLLDTRAAVLENVRLARGCGADGSQLLAVAAASTACATAHEALTLIADLSASIDAIALTTPAPHAALAELEPGLAPEPWPARFRLEVGDHELRGKLIFRDLLGQRTFFQVAALSIANVELDSRDAELLEQLGVLTQLTDPRVWPLAVTRRIARQGGTLACAVAGGIATMCTSLMTAQPVAAFMEFLDEVAARTSQGESVAEVVAQVVESGRRVLGVGRPVFKQDERVPHELALFERLGRGSGPSVSLARALDEQFAAQKDLRVNSAGFAGAVFRDLGFEPRAAAAFTVLFFIVPVLTHAATGQPV